MQSTEIKEFIQPLPRFAINQIVFCPFAKTKSGTLLFVKGIVAGFSFCSEKVDPIPGRVVQFDSLNTQWEYLVYAARDNGEAEFCRLVKESFVFEDCGEFVPRLTDVDGTKISVYVREQSEQPIEEPVLIDQGI